MRLVPLTVRRTQGDAVRFLTRVAACVLMSAVVTVGIGIEVAQAHSELTSSNPAARSVMSTAPAQIALTFSDTIEQRFSTVTISVGDGPPAKSKVEVRQNRLRAVVPDAVRRSGTWTVAFRVVSIDGHPISGTIPLTIKADPAASAPSTGTAEPSATPSAAASAPTTSPPGAAQQRLSGDQAQQVGTVADDRRRLLWWLAGAVGLMIALAASVYLARDRSP